MRTPPAATPPARADEPLVVQAEIDMNGIRTIVREEVTGALKQALLAGTGPVSMGYRVRPPAEASGAKADTPTFVPTGIVGAVKGDVTVDAQETEDSGISKASAALKARKTTRKKSTKAKGA